MKRLKLSPNHWGLTVFISSSRLPELALKAEMGRLYGTQHSSTPDLAHRKISALKVAAIVGSTCAALHGSLRVASSQSRFR